MAEYAHIEPVGYNIPSEMMLEQEGRRHFAVTDFTEIPGDETPPTIGDFSPPLGTAITPTTQIAFSITDETGLFCVIAIFARFEALGRYEVVHDESIFGPQYAGNSSRTVIDNGYRFSLRRREGWPEAVKIRALVRDRGGNMAVIE